MKLKAFFEKRSKAPSARPTLGELFRDTRFVVYVVLFAAVGVGMMTYLFFNTWLHRSPLWVDLMCCAAIILFEVCAWYFLGFIRLCNIRRRVRVGSVVFMGIMLLSLCVSIYFSHLRFLF